MSEHTKKTAAPPWTVWLPGWLVAVAGIAATAHGLFEVVRASAVPAGLAWLYPVITDGLALLAYAAAEQLTSKPARAYAWLVVVIAAGLSGLAQAAYLAGGVGETSTGAGDASPELRFGVGAWPAIAAAVVAHLLFLPAAERRNRQSEPAEPASPRPAVQGETVSSPPAVRAEAHRVDSPAVQRPAPRPVQPVNVQPTAVQRPVQRGAVQPSAVQRADVQDHEPAQRVQEPGVQRPIQQDPAPRGGSGSRALPAPATTKATEAARRWFAEHGDWPSVRELKDVSGVSQGTCGAVLNDLKAQPGHLHLVNATDETTETTQTRNPA